jgi:hypothetical protein
MIVSLACGVTSANRLLAGSARASPYSTLEPLRGSTFDVAAFDVPGTFPPRLTAYIGAASYADAPSYVCGACAWQFLLSVFS